MIVEFERRELYLMCTTLVRELEKTEHAYERNMRLYDSEFHSSDRSLNMQADMLVLRSIIDKALIAIADSNADNDGIKNVE